jgi:ATP-dependent Clp protease ATP-binding subunit ClpB
VSGSPYFANDAAAAVQRANAAMEGPGDEFVSVEHSAGILSGRMPYTLPQRHRLQR